MLDKIRRNSKQLFEPKRNSVSAAAASLPSPTPTAAKEAYRRKLTFFSLPPEIRLGIWEDVARDASISIPLTSNKNGKKATPMGRLGVGVGAIPSLLIASRQTRQEYLPMLLEFATVRVLIKDFDFRNLIRMLSSLYNTELKTLRKNQRLTIGLVAEKCDRDSIVSLRRWLDNRANGLDRLPWGYSIYWKPKYEIMISASEEKKLLTRYRRREILDQTLEGIAQLDKNVHENLQFELRPIIAAFEDEVKATPIPRDSDQFIMSAIRRSSSGTMCSV